MPSDDIVARLRLTPVLIRRDSLGQSVIDYEACKKYVNEEGVKLMREAADEIERLRKERDEARRSVCEMSIQFGGVFRRVGGKTVEVTTPQGCAEIMRWDCFKEARDER